MEEEGRERDYIKQKKIPETFKVEEFGEEERRVTCIDGHGCKRGKKKRGVK